MSWRFLRALCVSGAYHRRRVSPHPAGRRSRRARRGRPRPAHVRSALPGRAAARLDARVSASPRRGRWPPARRATSGSRGRIDAEDEFEDDAHRPLVFRRTRLQLRRDGRWVSFEDDRERVPFEVREGLDAIAVDDAALDVGLVVVPRESVGTAADAARSRPGRDGTRRRRSACWSNRSRRSSTRSSLGVPGLDAAGAPRLIGRARPAARPDHARARPRRCASWPRASAADRSSRRPAWPAGSCCSTVGSCWPSSGRSRERDGSATGRMLAGAVAGSWPGSSRPRSSSPRRRARRPVAATRAARARVRAWSATRCSRCWRSSRSACCRSSRRSPTCG